MSQDRDSDPPDDAGGAGPYVAVLLVAFVLILALLVYAARYRDEIVAILTQSPT